MIEEEPTVSVIIPTYNRAHTIKRAILSVLNQTYQGFEIIVVDDCSTDNTREVIEKFGDKRIRYIRKKANKGAAAAGNTGIKAVRGEYIVFLDSDDKWLPNKLDEQIKVLKVTSPKVGVVYTETQRLMRGQEFFIPNPKIDKKDGGQWCMWHSRLEAYGVF